MKRIKLLLILFLIIPVVPTSGCSSSPSYQGDIRPLRIVLIHNDYVDLDKSLDMLEEASSLTVREVGIKFIVVKVIALGSGSQYGNLDYKDHIMALCQTKALCLYERMKDKDFDMAIAFNNEEFLLKYFSWLYIKWFGVIDDTYRRYIVLYNPTVRVIRHEIYHAFILSKGHTSKLMGGMAVLNPAGGMLNSQDKEEVLKNKYRDFSKRPRVRIVRDRLESLSE